MAHCPASSPSLLNPVTEKNKAPCTHCCRIIGMLTQLAAATAAKGTHRATKGGALCWRQGIVEVTQDHAKVRVEKEARQVNTPLTCPDIHSGILKLLSGAKKAVFARPLLPPGGHCAHKPQPYIPLSTYSCPPQWPLQW